MRFFCMLSRNFLPALTLKGGVRSSSARKESIIAKVHNSLGDAVRNMAAVLRSLGRKIKNLELWTIMIFFPLRILKLSVQCLEQCWLYLSPFLPTITSLFGGNNQKVMVKNQAKQSPGILSSPASQSPVGVLSPGGGETPTKRRHTLACHRDLKSHEVQCIGNDPPKIIPSCILDEMGSDHGASEKEESPSASSTNQEIWVASREIEREKKRRWSYPVKPEHGPVKPAPGRPRVV